MKALTNLSLIVWIIFGLMNIAISVLLIRTMIIFAAWLLTLEEGKEITNVLQEWC